MVQPPTVTVVIPTYNRARFLPKALSSIFSQSSHAAEVIVVNDGSTDETREIIASYGSSIKAIHQDNGGLSSARNAGIRAATSEWVAFLDDDDEYVPGRLAIAAESIRLHPDVEVHATNTAIVNGNGLETDLFALRHRNATEHMRLERPLTWVLSGCFFAQTLVARRSAIIEAGMFRRTFYEDMDLFVRLAARGPWTVDVRKSLRLQRLTGEDQDLSSYWKSKPVENYEALTRIHRDALAIHALTPDEKMVAESGLATNLFELGRALHLHGEPGRARECFIEAGRTYPRLHSRTKARLATIFGSTTLRFLEIFRRQHGFRSASNHT